VRHIPAEPKRSKPIARDDDGADLAAGNCIDVTTTSATLSVRAAATASAASAIRFEVKLQVQTGSASQYRQAANARHRPATPARA
jgi:hypothetical protein